MARNVGAPVMAPRAQALPCDARRPLLTLPGGADGAPTRRDLTEGL